MLLKPGTLTGFAAACSKRCSSERAGCEALLCPWLSWRPHQKLLCNLLSALRPNEPSKSCMQILCFRVDGETCILAYTGNCVAIRQLSGGAVKARDLGLGTIQTGVRCCWRGQPSAQPAVMVRRCLEVLGLWMKCRSINYPLVKK